MCVASDIVALFAFQFPVEFVIVMLDAPSREYPPQFKSSFAVTLNQILSVSYVVFVGDWIVITGGVVSGGSSVVAVMITQGSLGGQSSGSSVPAGHAVIVRVLVGSSSPSPT